MAGAERGLKAVGFTSMGDGPRPPGATAPREYAGRLAMMLRGRYVCDQNLNELVSHQVRVGFVMKFVGTPVGV